MFIVHKTLLVPHCGTPLFKQFRRMLNLFSNIVVITVYQREAYWISNFKICWKNIVILSRHKWYLFLGYQHKIITRVRLKKACLQALSRKLALYRFFSTDVFCSALYLDKCVISDLLIACIIRADYIMREKTSVWSETKCPITLLVHRLNHNLHHILLSALPQGLLLLFLFKNEVKFYVLILATSKQFTRCYPFIP